MLDGEKTFMRNEHEWLLTNRQHNNYMEQVMWWQTLQFISSLTD